MAKKQGISGFIEELRRRRVFRVGAVYAATVFIIIQIIDGAFPALHIPEWIGSLVIILMLLGFPLAIALSWVIVAAPAGSPGVRPSENSAADGVMDEAGPIPAPASKPIEPTPGGTPPLRSIAVLSFTDMSREGDQEYFGDGMAEELIDALTKIEDLQVVARSTAFAFKSQDMDIREVGRRLNVETVLEGSIRKSGNQVRVTAQLVKVADGYHMWSEKYDRDAEDIFAIQDEIAENIVRALKVVLSAKEKQALEKAPTTDAEAYDYYLRGRKFFNEFRRKSLEYARQMFTRAAQIDPGYALAYAGHADCHSQLYMYWESTEENLRTAEESSQKALELDPDLAEVHVARGLAVSLSNQYDEAEKAFEIGIRLNPKLFEAHYFYARTCFGEGKLDRAARLFEEASQVRPEDYQAPYFLGQTYVGLGLMEKAEVAYRQCLENALKHLELNPDDARATYLGAAVLIHLGKQEQGLEWARRALAMDPEDSSILYNIACIYSLAGGIDEAIDCLERARLAGFAHKEWIEHDSDLDSLRDDSRFQELLSQMPNPG